MFDEIWKWFSAEPVLVLKVQPLSELKKMTKKELEDYGRKFGYEVDRRLTKDKIIKEVSKLK